MFQLSKSEFEKLQNDLIFQNGISRWGGTRKLPYAFTEQGLAMLSGVLNSEIAIEVNISIMRAFVAIRRMATSLPNATTDVAQLRKDFEELKLDIEDILHDQNDINESTRMQLDAISIALAALGFAACYQRDARTTSQAIRAKASQAHWLHTNKGR